VELRHGLSTLPSTQNIPPFTKKIVFFVMVEPKDRKSRFEIQHSQQQQQQPQPPQPPGTPPQQQIRFDTVPLSRDNSLSQHSIHRDSPSGKVSRFSVEPTREIGRPSRENGKDRESHASDTVSSTSSIPVECRKKGRFELTGGSSTPLSSSSQPVGHSDRLDKADAQYHESAHSSVSGSPSTSPSSSLSRGQIPRLTDQASAHILTSHLEALLKQNETQRIILNDLYGGMGGAPNPNISRSRAGSESRRAPFPIMEPIEPKPLSNSTDVLFGMVSSDITHHISIGVVGSYF
jgi:hypothetical protein